MHEVGIGLGLNIDFLDSLGTVLVRERDIAHIVFVEGVGVRSDRGRVFVINMKNAHREIGGAQIHSSNFNQLTGSHQGVTR